MKVLLSLSNKMEQSVFFGRKTIYNKPVPHPKTSEWQFISLWSISPPQFFPAWCNNTESRSHHDKKWLLKIAESLCGKAQSWSSWLWRIVNTDEVPSSILGDCTFCMLALAGPSFLGWYFTMMINYYHITSLSLFIILLFSRTNNWCWQQRWKDLLHSATIGKAKIRHLLMLVVQFFC